MAAQQLTYKEELVIAEFEKMRPGTGALARQNILNPNTGWAEMIEAMSEEEIQVTSMPKPNTFIYHHIG